MREGPRKLSTFTYGPGGKLSESSLSDGTRARYEYQLSGLRSKMIYADGRRVEFTYDPAGNLTATKVFDARGKQTNGQNLEMNDSYQLIRWTIFDGSEKVFRYDPNGNLTDIIAGAAVTKFEYDALDRLTAVVAPNGQRTTYSYSPSQRSVIEEYQHANLNLVDLRDTGLTFTDPFTGLASRPLTAPLGSVRFSETLGSFLLANADGSEIVRPHEAAEAALAKLHLYQTGMSQTALRSGFGAPFNSMFIPAEYLTINCCPECYYDGDTWICPPCNGGGGLDNCQSGFVNVTASDISSQCVLNGDNARATVIGQGTFFVNSVSATSDNTIEIIAPPTFDNSVAYIGGQRTATLTFVTNLGGRIFWTFNVTCDSGNVTNLTGTQNVKCPGP